MFNKLKLSIHRLIGSKYTIFIILFLAFVMRLVAVNQSLWLDEAIGAYAVKNFTYKALLAEFMKFDFHPPLYYLLLKAWTELFGYSELFLRLPSILFGLGAIWLTYAIARLLVERNNWQFPLLAAVLLAISQFHIYYSQEARMYMMAAFLATLSIYCLLRILREEKKRNLHLYLIFSITLAALIFTDYMPVFMFPVYAVAPLLYKKGKSWWIRYLPTFIFPTILGFLWLPTLFIQASSGKQLMESLPAWREIIGGSNIKQLALVWMKFIFGRISLLNKPLYYLLVVLASIPVLASFLAAVKNRKQEIDIVILWLTVPLGLGFMASFLFPAFNYFRYVYVIPAFYLLVSWGAINIKKSKIRILVISSLILFNTLSWLIYVFDVKLHREQWRQATNFVESKAKELDVAIFEYPRPFTPYRWYSSGLVESYGITDAVASDMSKTKQKTEKAISGRRGVYYFEYLADLSDPGRVAVEVLKDKGFQVREVYNFEGVGQVFYYTK